MAEAMKMEIENLRVQQNNIDEQISQITSQSNAKRKRDDTDTFKLETGTKKKTKSYTRTNPELDNARSALSLLVGRAKLQKREAIEENYARIVLYVKQNGTQPPHPQTRKSWYGAYAMIMMKRSGKKGGGGGAIVKARNIRIRSGIASALQIPVNKVSRKTIRSFGDNPESLRKLSAFARAQPGKGLRAFTKRTLTRFQDSNM